MKPYLFMLWVACAACATTKAPATHAIGDWCPEHGVRESQCVLCHPELATAAPQPPEGADFVRISDGGRDLASLDPVRGKITLFDFYAEWCGPCRQVDAHVFELMKSRPDLAYRKLDIVSWETPLARHHLAGVSGLPYVVVFGSDGKPTGRMSGLHLDELDRAIAAGAR